MNVRHLVSSVSRRLLSMGSLMLAAGLQQPVHASAIHRLEGGSHWHACVRIPPCVRASAMDRVPPALRPLWLAEVVDDNVRHQRGFCPANCTANTRPSQPDRLPRRTCPASVTQTCHWVGASALT